MTSTQAEVYQSMILTPHNLQDQYEIPASASCEPGSELRKAYDKCKACVEAGSSADEILLGAFAGYCGQTGYLKTITLTNTDGGLTTLTSTSWVAIVPSESSKRVTGTYTLDDGEVVTVTYSVPGNSSGQTPTPTPSAAPPDNSGKIPRSLQYAYPILIRSDIT